MNWASDVDDGNVDDEILRTLSDKVRCQSIQITSSDQRLQRQRQYNNRGYPSRSFLLRSMHVLIWCNTSSLRWLEFKTKNNCWLQMRLLSFYIMSKYLNSRIYNLRFRHKYENKCIALINKINFRKQNWMISRSCELGMGKT